MFHSLGSILTVPENDFFKVLFVIFPQKVLIDNVLVEEEYRISYPFF